MLDAPPLPEVGVLPWSQWESIAAGPDPVARPYTIGWHQGERGQLRDLFELADDSSEQLDRYIDLGRVLVALDDRGGEVIGHLQLIPTAQPGVEEIKSLAVRADFRRRGVGRALVDRAIEACRVEQATGVTVTTAVADVDNLRFYQRCGFRASSIERDAFMPESGYRLGLSAFGIPLRDAIRFDLGLGRPDQHESRDGHE
jgi:ribosomal protein S18 acetylase RimI-like enzyme